MSVSLVLRLILAARLCVPDAIDPLSEVIAKERAFYQHGAVNSSSATASSPALQTSRRCIHMAGPTVVER
jgi:hypothetical protein